MPNDDASIDVSSSSEAGSPLGELTIARAIALGEEAREIARLVAGGVRGFEGRIVTVRADAMEALEALVSEGLALTGLVAVRPFFPTAGASRVFAEAVHASLDVRDAGELEALVDALRSATAEKALRAAFGGSRHLPLRVVAIDPGSLGHAASCDPTDGDPELVGVRRGHAPWYRVERKSGRTAHVGEGLDDVSVESMADLVDRCQIELGRPIQIEWATRLGKPVVLTLEPLRPDVAFAPAPLRRVALVAADEGTVAPLAIDALDRGLCRTRERVPGAIASRLYARPYRRLEIDGRILGAPMGAVSAATSAAAKVAYEAAVAFHGDGEFCKDAEERAEKLAAADLALLDDDALLLALEERHALVAQAFGRLDGCRELTRRAIVALEIAVGPMAREIYPALSTPKSTRDRVRIGLELADLGRRIGPELASEDVRRRLEPTLGRRWDELKETLREVRPLGIDLVPSAIGASDASMRLAIVAAPPRRRIDALEEARWGAIRRVLAMANSQPYGAARAGVVSSVGLVLDRIVTSKGKLAEVLALTLGLLRSVALEIGRRLVDRAQLDSAADAFYLVQDELDEALRGEPSGLAARVRARLEDDARWRWFDAPRRLRE